MPGNVTCRSCGKEVAAGDMFCAGCGTAVTPEPATVVSHVSLRNAQATRLVEATKGEFEILEQLGTGAMGAVYLAKDIALGRKVAIKVIAPHLLSDETMISRFRMEAQTVASLRHPNIVNVHAVRQSSDLHFFVMEFIDGPPLRNLVKQYAPIDVDVVQSIMFQVGSALSYAHRTRGGLIHRDVKPANVMVDAEGDAFVTDFGISKIAEAQTGLTQTGATIGTPEYMSPEQCRGEALSGASDQYALGIVAYEMLCGHTPFSGSQYHIMVAHTTEAPKPIRESRPDCPARVAEAVERMLAKAPDERWPDLDAAVMAMGGSPLGYHDPVRQKIKALTGATLMHVPAVSTGSRSGASGGRATLDTATSVTVLGVPPVLETGERIQLRADVRGSGNASLAGEGVEWASTDPAIASVDNGWVEGLEPGTVSIMAVAGNVASSVLLTVAEPAPARVMVRPMSVRMHRGGRIGLKAEVQDKRGRPLQRELRWISSDPQVATVSATGEVTASGSGPVTITAESEGATGAAEIVVEVPVAAAPPAPPKPAAPPPAPKPAASRKAPAQARPPSPKPPEAKPAAPAAKPEKPRAPRPRPAPAPAGTRPAYKHPAAIAAALATLAGVGVVGVLSSGGGGPTPPRPASGVDQGATASGTPAGRAGGASPSGGTPATRTPSTQPSGDAPGAGSGASRPGSTATAGPQTSGGGDQQAADPPGQVASGARGQAEPTSSGRGQDPAAGRGQAAPAAGGGAPSPTPAPTPVRVRVAVPSASMPVGGTQSATAQVFAAGGAPMGPGSYSLSWRSSNGSVLAVSTAGALRAASPGSAWVVGTAGAVRDSVLVTVAASVAAVDIAQQDFGMEAGSAPRALRASVLDQGRRPLDRPVTWSSSNAAVATVDAAGRVTPVAAGSAQITASADGFSDRVTVSVTPPAPALPTADQARAAVQAYVAALGQRDRDLVTRLWGSGDAARRDAVLDLFGQNNFTATLGAVGAPTQAGAAATVTFQVAAAWRTNFGQNRGRDLDFRARLERVGSQWRVAAAAVQ